VFQQDAFQNDVTGTGKAFQVVGSAAAPPGPVCLLLLEDGTGFVTLEDDSGRLLLEQCPPERAVGKPHAVRLRRQRRRALQRALKAARRVEDEINDPAVSAAEQEALRQAAIAANRAIVAAYDEAASAEVNADLLRLANSLNATASARRTSETIAHARRAIATAHAMVAQAQAQEDDEMQIILLALQ
jgi:hypothetical protein